MKKTNVELCQFNSNLDPYSVSNIDFDRIAVGLIMNPKIVMYVLGLVLISWKVIIFSVKNESVTCNVKQYSLY